MLFNLLLNDLLKAENKLVGICSKTLDRLFSLYFQTMTLSNSAEQVMSNVVHFSLIQDYANSQRQRHPIRNDPYGQRPPIQTNPHVYGAGNTQQGNIRTSKAGYFALILLDFLGTVKAAPHEYVIRTGQP